MKSSVNSRWGRSRSSSNNSSFPSSSKTTKKPRGSAIRSGGCRIATRDTHLAADAAVSIDAGRHRPRIAERFAISIGSHLECRPIAGLHYIGLVYPDAASAMFDTR